MESEVYDIVCSPLCVEGVDIAFTRILMGFIVLSFPLWIDNARCSLVEAGKDNTIFVDSLTC